MNENQPVFKPYHLLICITFAFILAGCIFLFILQPLIQHYIYKARFDGRGITIGDFCKNFQSLEKPILLIMGPSVALYSINGILLQTLLNNTYDVYHLSVTAADPTIQSIYADCFIKIKPKIIIYSFIQADYGGITTHDDMYVILSPYISLSPIDERYIILPEHIQKIITLNPLQQAIYKKKYITHFINTLIKKISNYQHSNNELLQYITNNDQFRDLKNPYPGGDEKPYSDNELYSLLANNSFMQNFANQSSNFTPDNYQLVAFEHMIKKMNNNNISIILLHSPLNTPLLQQLNSTRQQAFHTYINNTCKNSKCTYLNFEAIYENISSQPPLFIDSVHLTRVGQQNFTEILAKNLHEKRLA